MKSLLAILSLLILPLAAQEQLPATNPSTRDQLMDALMNAPDTASLNTAISQSRKAGLPEQMLLEARFVFLVNENNLTALAALAPALEKQLPAFSPDDTLIFAVKEDFESIVNYTKALDALLKKDTALFKKHITEAFWLSPDHASQFAPHIKTLRMKEAMAKVTLDLTRTFKNQKNKAKQTSLKSLQGDAPALLIHFWSPWVQQSILAMPEFAKLSKTLIANKIPVASFVLTGNPESQKDADTFLEQKGNEHPGEWLIDSEKSSLASTLRISSFPTVALIDPKGGILFNGDPADPALWDQLVLLNPKIQPPTEDLVLPKNDSESKNPAPNTRE